jgi:VCBS repeat-containing protein
VADGARFGSGLDNGSAALSASLVGSQVNFGGVTYLTGPIGAANVVAAQGQSINLPSGNYKSLNILATGVKGNQANQTFTVRYTDGTSQTFTRSISDWYTPQSYAGESIALKMSYRNTSAGLRDNRPFYLYSYSLPLNSAKSVRSITLPGNSNVEILAMTAVN